MTAEERHRTCTSMIIKFMGLNTYENYKGTLFDNSQPDYWQIDIAGWDITSSKFHSSWDWLMPVYKKSLSELRLISEKAKKTNNSFNDKQKFLKRIDDIDAAIRCDIWGVRIKEVFNGICEAIVFVELYKDIDKKKDIGVF